MAATIIVALDFGTTYSGVAWATTANFDNPEIIQSWPGSQNRTSDKVPTKLNYSNTESQTPRWGFQIPPTAECVRGLKLLLDECQEDRYNSATQCKALLTKHHKSPVQAAADYLRELFRAGRQHIERRFGCEFVSSANVKVILTVPAIWSDKAHDATLRAAEAAGLARFGDNTTLQLLSEPEAAALHTLRAIRPNNMMVNDIFVVCDAGGGTVDLITYRIRNLEPMELEELVPGSGGICGSIALDKRFEEYVEDRLGPLQKQITARGRSTMLSSWIEDVKCIFEGSDEELDEYLVTVPGVRNEPCLGIEEGFMPIGTDDIETLFEPIVKEIEELVESQITQAQTCGDHVKAVLLVGGFGASPYLYKRLATKFHGIQVLQPPNAWTAVVRGAVLYGSQVGSVTSRTARRNYGVVASTRYDAERHDGLTKRWDDLDEEWRIDNSMTWYVRRGTRIADKERIAFSFCRKLRERSIRPDHLRFEDELLCSEQEVAPSIRGKDSVFKLCTLVADLSQVPTTLFEKRTNSKGECFYKIKYDLVMVMSSASIVFTLEFNGVPYGGIRAAY